MATVRADSVSGTIQNTNGISNTDTTLESADLADLPVVSGGDIARITFATFNGVHVNSYEIVHVTDHTDSATTATISRGQEGTTAQSWDNGTNWFHAITVNDLEDHYTDTTNPHSVDYTQTGAPAQGDVVGIVFHGNDGTVSRPTGYSYVEWRGDAEPDNAQDNDIWIPDTLGEQHSHTEYAVDPHGDAAHSNDYAASGHTHPKEDVSARAARVFLSNRHNAGDSTFTKVLLDAVTDDPSGLFDSANNQFVLDKSGWWIIAAAIGSEGDTSGTRRMSAIAHNGSRITRGGIETGSGNPVYATVFDIVKATSGDTIESFLYQDSGGTIEVLDDSRYTWLSVAYFGSA